MSEPTSMQGPASPFQNSYCYVSLQKRVNRLETQQRALEMKLDIQQQATREEIAALEDKFKSSLQQVKHFPSHCAKNYSLANA